MKNSEKRASPSAATVLRSREIIAPGVLERMGPLSGGSGADARVDRRIGLRSP